MVAAAVRSAAQDALIATGSADPSAPPRHWSWLRTAGHLAGGYASLRSVWFLNSARGAVALAAAVAVADLVHVQHGFWVVLGTLSVLRTNATSTGATALRALVGTAAGFFIGAAFILAIGQDTAALWVALPIAILVASYSPGTAPFAVGQAAFTLTVSVLYNILVPVGWKVGVLRVEDVAIGAAVSAFVGLLFWPRGASSIVADDLADAFHEGGIYLVQATSWAVGSRPARPDAGIRAVNAGLRVDDALRGFLAEQGTKHVPKEHVWRLVGGALRIRLTAQSLSNLPPPSRSATPAVSRWSRRPPAWRDGVMISPAILGGRRLRRPESSPPLSPTSCPRPAGNTATFSGFSITSTTYGITWPTSWNRLRRFTSSGVSPGGDDAIRPDPAGSSTCLPRIERRSLPPATWVSSFDSKSR